MDYWYLAWGYYAAAMRGEIPQVLSLEAIDRWLRAKYRGKPLTDIGREKAARNVYALLEKHAVRKGRDAQCRKEGEQLRYHQAG